MQIDFQHNSLIEQEIEPDLQLVIFRIIQERMSNILKYAFATQVLIKIKKETVLLTLIFFYEMEQASVHWQSEKVLA